MGAQCQPWRLNSICFDSVFAESQVVVTRNLVSNPRKTPIDYRRMSFRRLYTTHWWMLFSINGHHRLLLLLRTSCVPWMSQDLSSVQTLKSLEVIPLKNIMHSLMNVLFRNEWHRLLLHVWDSYKPWMSQNLSSFQTVKSLKVILLKNLTHSLMNVVFLERSTRTSSAGSRFLVITLIEIQGIQIVSQPKHFSAQPIHLRTNAFLHKYGFGYRKDRQYC